MSYKYSIPRFTDDEILLALSETVDELPNKEKFSVLIDIPYLGNVDVNNSSSNKEAVESIRKLKSSLGVEFTIRFEGGQNVVIVKRPQGQPWDQIYTDVNWISNVSQQNKDEYRLALYQAMASLRIKLKANRVESSFSVDDDTEWTRFRGAQMEVLHSLEKTAEQVIINSTQEYAKRDKEREDRFQDMEKDLRDQLAKERVEMLEVIKRKNEELEEKERIHDQNVSEFETKESRYVSRQTRKEQIKQIQGWIDEWNLTKGTRSKRYPIAVAYCLTLILLAGLTFYATHHNYMLLKSADDLSKLQWWHWVAITTKSFFPLAAFSSFMIYFIRWSSQWARLHAEEEFRNRSLLIDIGRSGWLLEAVTDAKDKKSEIPENLLKELSKNLFSTLPNSDSDIHPSAVGDIFLQGLNSLRVKSADGSEIEATRKKGA